MSEPAPVPFRSKAQRRKWAQLVSEGRVTQDQFDIRDGVMPEAQLPERASPRIRTVGASRAPAIAKPQHARY